MECEIVPIETRGDEITDRPLPEIGGDGAFTERIERALRESRIDIAVHSLKDLPVQDPDELCIGAVLGREEVREVLVTRDGAGLRHAAARRRGRLQQHPPPGAAPRPAARPRGAPHPRQRGDADQEGGDRGVRCNRPGRRRGGAAGPARERSPPWIEISDILPAPGQGAIAVQCRDGGCGNARGACRHRRAGPAGRDRGGARFPARPGRRVLRAGRARLRGP